MSEHDLPDYGITMTISEDGYAHGQLFSDNESFIGTILELSIIAGHEEDSLWYNTTQVII